MLAAAPAIELLEARCPICEAELKSAAGASSAIGFRLFDLDPLADPGSGPLRDARVAPADLLSRREAPSAQAARSAPLWPSSS